MKFEVPHTLSKDEAKKRVDALLRHWQKKYGLKASWTGETAKLTGKVMGIAFDASLVLGENRVVGEGTDPGMLLRGRAQKYLTRKFGEYLDPGKSVEELEREA